MITLKDLAREVGVSTHTISDILGGDMRYSDKTRKRVMEAADRFGYRPNRQARVLRGAKSGIIGMIKSASVVQTPLERVLFAGEAIHSAGYELVAYDVYWHHDGLERAVDGLIDARAEGIIVSAVGTPDLTRSALQRLFKSDIPLVIMSGGIWPERSYVSANFRRGGELQAGHLLNLGYRRPLILMGEGDQRHDSVAKRVEGALSAFEAAGLSVPLVRGPATEREGSEARPLDASYQPGYEAMARLIRSGEVPDAVVCINDYIAIAAIQACHDHGLRVPEDIAFIGFDNSTAGVYSIPRLTTIHQPTREIAWKTVEVLVEEIRNGGPRNGTPEMIEMDCHLVPRESCGCKLNSTSSSTL